MNEEKKEKMFPGGCGPAFEVTDLPEAPRDLTPRKLFAILGPAVIALGGTIGGGEWLVLPSSSNGGLHSFGSRPSQPFSKPSLTSK